MEITERQLRRMVREADDVHREGMETFSDDNRELIFGELRHGRAGTSRQTMASILPVEAQHAITLGFVLGKPLDDETLMPPFETTDAALDPAELPAA